MNITKFFCKKAMGSLLSHLHNIIDLLKGTFHIFVHPLIIFTLLSFTLPTILSRYLVMISRFSQKLKVPFLCYQSPIE